jgi:transcriptional regulator with PAS, ATPase and Fis domain
VNCGAIPETLVESYLFGHSKGAFTGAIKDQKGKFDQAHKGSLFLDEIAELPLQTQTKLLRVLQDGMIEPIGADKPHKVDVRIIAATNKDIKKQIKNGEFREDLYYRLNVGQITIPPLRDRKTDIPKIALSVLDKVNSNLKRGKRITPEALKKLQSYHWAGNIRDLENVIERSALLTKNDVIGVDDLIFEGLDQSTPILTEPYEGFILNEYLDSQRRGLINLALEEAEGNQSKAARLLGITPQAIHKFLKE